MVAIDVERKYEAGAAAATVAEVVAVWKTPDADVDGFNSESLLKMVKSFLEGWYNGGKQESFDYDLQALLALLLACHDTWFTAAQREDIAAWMKVVADTEEATRWVKSFQDAEAVTAAVQEGLETTEPVEVECSGSTVTITYRQGEYGTGRHDGTLVLDSASLTILNKSAPGQRTVYSGDLPSTPEELLACLQDEAWETK